MWVKDCGSRNGAAEGHEEKKGRSGEVSRLLELGGRPEIQVKEKY